MIIKLPPPLPLTFIADALEYIVASTRDDGFYGFRRGLCRCVYVARLMAATRRKFSAPNAASEPRP